MVDYTRGYAEMMKHFSSGGAFLTAKSEMGVNTMTIAWGFVGYMWRMPCFLTVVRPQRFTRKILKGANSFTVSVPFGGLKEELLICGKQSGADIDKSKVVTFVPSQTVESPIVASCNLYYECLIRNVDSLSGENMDADVIKNYPIADYHDLFFGEIVACYGKEALVNA